MSTQNSGEVQQNAIFGTANVERKKYDPIYSIVLFFGEEEVIYVGKLFSFGINSNLLTIKGVCLSPVKRKGGVSNLSDKYMLEKLESETNIEDTFPVIAFKRIRKIA